MITYKSSLIFAAVSPIICAILSATEYFGYAISTHGVYIIVCADQLRIAIDALLTSDSKLHWFTHFAILKSYRNRETSSSYDGDKVQNCEMINLMRLRR